MKYGEYLQYMENLRLDEIEAKRLEEERKK
jgi:hypothetical protein